MKKFNKNCVNLLFINYIYIYQLNLNLVIKINLNVNSKGNHKNN